MAGERSAPEESITALLAEFSAGNQQAEDRLVAKVYGELRRSAARHLRRERPNHSLQPTELVDEAWMRLVEGSRQNWQDRAHFFAVASRIMRQILVDHARRRIAAKRGGGREPITLEEPFLPSRSDPVEVLALHEALERLQTFDARASRIIELLFFGGLTLEEVALVLDVSVRTVKRDLKMARAWLRSGLSKNPNDR